MGRQPWTGEQILPADRLHSAYNALLAVLWVTCLTRSSLVVPLSVLHLIAAGLPVLIRRAPKHLSLGVAVLREYYPLLWLECYWVELDSLIRLLHSGNHDAAILRLETALWGGLWNPDTVASAPNWLMNETMYFFYASYLPLLVIPPIVLGVLGRIGVLRDLCFRVSLVSMVCFSIYLAWPVAGPAFRPGGLSPATGAFSHGMHVIRSLGDSEGSAFPSSHVAISVTIALVGWRWLPRRMALALAALVVIIAVACVYTRNHYVIDVVAGAALAMILQPLAVRAQRHVPGRVLPRPV
jgi:membrane-associated phospholipid phosphatase